MLIGNIQCGHCGSYHTGACPRVRAIEYHPNGTVKRIEYHEPTPVQPIRLSADDLYEISQR